MTDLYGESSYRRVLEGDLSDVETCVVLQSLIKRYGDGLVRFAYCFVKNSATAEDIMEDTFATLLVKRKRFKSGENLRAYLYKITRNKCIDYLRFHRRFTSLNDLEQVLFTEDTERDILSKQRNKILYRCMQAIPAQYAQTLYLLYFENCRVEEICAILKKNKKQVYNFIARGKTALKTLLEKEGISHEDV